MAGEGGGGNQQTDEDTICENEDDGNPPDVMHRNYDRFMEDTGPGVHFLSATKHVPGCRRRAQTRLGISRLPFIEPNGNTREDFYEAKLVQSLAWYCPEHPRTVVGEDGREKVEWTFQWDAPGDEDMDGAHVESEVLSLGKESVSFEMVCNRLETKFCSAELDKICRCCAQEVPKAPCDACRYATGWHLCQNENNVRHFLWRKGSLHAGSLDVQRVLFNLHRKLVPTAVLEEKAKAYAEKGLISADMAKRMLTCIQQERNHEILLNDGVGGDGRDAAVLDPASAFSTRLSPAQMAELLAKREAMMQDGAKGGEGGVTDQWTITG